MYLDNKNSIMLQILDMEDFDEESKEQTKEQTKEEGQKHEELEKDQKHEELEEKEEQNWIEENEEDSIIRTNTSIDEYDMINDLEYYCNDSSDDEKNQKEIIQFINDQEIESKQKRCPDCNGDIIKKDKYIICKDCGLQLYHDNYIQEEQQEKFLNTIENKINGAISLLDELFEKVGFDEEIKMDEIRKMVINEIQKYKKKDAELITMEMFNMQTQNLFLKTKNFGIKYYLESGSSRIFDEKQFSFVRNKFVPIILQDYFEGESLLEVLEELEEVYDILLNNTFIIEKHLFETSILSLMYIYINNVYQVSIEESIEKIICMNNVINFQEQLDKMFE